MTAELTWEAVADADTYNLYWETTGGVSPESGTLVEDVNSPYTHEGIDNDSSYYYVMTAVNEEGESAPSTEVSAELSLAPPELDPPEPDTTTRTTMAETTRFLYEGEDPPQKDVDVEQMVDHRRTILKGRVTTRAGEALPNVAVRIKGRPEFGNTRTRENGRFDMVVNGGGKIVVQFEHEEYLSVQRKLQPKWGRFERIPRDVAMTPEDPERTIIDMDVDDWQVVRASEMEDVDGKRQAKLFVPPETSAVHVDGGTAPERLEISATEFTVGEEGIEAMPGQLPRQVAYTYALEFLARDPDADENDGGGDGNGGSAFIDPGDTGDVEFDKPVYHYLENFIGFPVGEFVPMGSFDEDSSNWVAHPDGVVLEVLDTSDGAAEIDVEGEGDPADEDVIDDLDITDAELAFLAEEFKVGDELWRTPVPHFSAWDCNWPIHPPSNVDGPADTPDGPDNDPEDDPCENGSHGY